MKVTKLGDLPACVGVLKSLISNKPELGDALSAFGLDLNGDGQALVQVSGYQLSLGGEEETGASGERHDVREGFGVIGQFAINHGAAQIHNATRKTNRDGCERVGKRRKEGRLEENAPMRVDDLRLLSLRRIRKLVAILFVTLQSESHHFKHRT